jgi:hypothetical protein
MAARHGDRLVLAVVRRVVEGGAVLAIAVALTLGTAAAQDACGGLESGISAIPLAPPPADNAFCQQYDQAKFLMTLLRHVKKY